ncbi:MAG: alpha/beta hydrolase fold domain-containing protein, partial [Parazoarcus communis]
MRNSSKQIRLCDCNRTQPLDGERLGSLLADGELTVHHALCRQELPLLEAALGGGGTVAVSCTQESALFSELADSVNASQRIQFFNLRENAGWSAEGAQATPKMAALIAASSGRKVVSIDYTLAPRGNCESILEEVIAVWSALLETRAGAAMGLIGDSAGGCIAASATHLLRDRSIAMPAALILLSPAADLTLGGDTNLTLTAVDYLDQAGLANGVKAYAGGLALDDPRVSPLF